MTGRVLAERLRRGDALYMGWVGLPEPLVAELVARSGFDCVCLEGQHALQSADSIMRGVSGIALGGKPSVVRIPVGEYALASRALDLGAEAIIAPMVNSVDDARAFVAATKYPPLGERSWGPLRTMTLGGIDPLTQLSTANTETLAIAMIETPQALDRLDDILAVDGIDGVFMGPSDLSLTLSQGASVDPFDPSLDGPIRRIAEATLAAGKVPAAFAATGKRAREFRDIGYRLIAVGNDQMYLGTGIAAALDEAR